VNRSAVSYESRYQRELPRSWVQMSTRQPQLERMRPTVLYGRNPLLPERRGHRQRLSFGTPWWQRRVTGGQGIGGVHGGVKGRKRGE